MRLVVRVKLGSVILSLAGCEEEYSLTQDFDGAVDAAALVAVIRSLETHPEPIVGQQTASGERAGGIQA